VLFDQGTPVPLRRHLSGHQIETAHERGWGDVSNGELLARAEAEGFDVLVTTDQNLRYQQNLSVRRIAIVVLGATSWPRLQRVLSDIGAAVSESSAGGFAEVLVPYVE
jgi:hypothetical protein